MSTKRLGEALDILAKHIDACGPCDHSVNICVCGDKSALEDARAELAAIRKAAKAFHEWNSWASATKERAEAMATLVRVAEEG